jgi:hypothetical protein
MKRVLLVVATALAMASSSVMADTVFSDTFGSGSTINSTPTAPTANSASYQNWSQGANPANFSIASGALHFEARNTTSVFSEVEAQFASTPVTLATAGDYVNLTLVFTDTLGVMLSGQGGSAQLTLGLYNSGGVLPMQGSRLDAGTAYTGGAAGYVGYIGRLMLNGNGNILTRSAQTYVGAGTGDLSRNQDLIFNGAGSGAFNSPTATAVGLTTATGFTTGLTQGGIYTLDYNITLTGVNTLTITESIYSGNTVSGTPLATWSSVASGATYLTSSFDSLAFGWRRNVSAATASSVDVGSILVTDYIQNVPEPGSAMLLGGGLGLLALIRRFRR